MRWTGIVAAAVVALSVGAGAWAQQQPAPPGGPMGPGAPGMPGMPGPPGPGMMMGPGQGMGPGGPRGGTPLERPIVSEILSAKDQLGLTADQEKKLRGLRADFEKEAIRRGAEIQAAEVDLRELLAADPPEMGKVEPQVKKIAALQGELRFARIKAQHEGRSVLSKDQWQKFEALPRRGGPGGPGRGRGERARPGS